MITRAHLESLAAPVLEFCGEEIAKQYLLVLAEAPEEPFKPLAQAEQVNRALMLMRAYKGAGTERRSSVGVEIISASADGGVLLNVVDLRDGANVLAPLPLAFARQLAMQILRHIDDVENPTEEEDEEVAQAQPIN